jgi:hypothetical protein
VRYPRAVSPFREPPGIELGPLEVGLARAARRAMTGVIPSGGRLIAPERYACAVHGEAAPSQRRAHAAGALGSMGLLLVGACAFVAGTAGWSPQGAGGTAVTVALVIAGGCSLAAVLRAIDSPRERLTLRGDEVGTATRRALRRALRLARSAARSPERFGPGRIAALRETLEMLGAPLVADWIPADVRGRAELLLARAVAANAGARWTRDPRVRAEVRSLLLSAAEHLVEPAPALSDLLLLAGPSDAVSSVREPLQATLSRAGAEPVRRLPRQAPAVLRFAALEAHEPESDGTELSGGEADHATLRR